MAHAPGWRVSMAPALGCGRPVLDGCGAGLHPPLPGLRAQQPRRRQPREGVAAAPASAARPRPRSPNTPPRAGGSAGAARAPPRWAGQAPPSSAPASRVVPGPRLITSPRIAAFAPGRASRTPRRARRRAASCGVQRHVQARAPPRAPRARAAVLRPPPTAGHADHAPPCPLLLLPGRRRIGRSVVVHLNLKRHRREHGQSAACRPSRCSASSRLMLSLTGVARRQGCQRARAGRRDPAARRAAAGSPR